MIVVDSSGQLAALSPDQRCHAECARVLAEREDPLLLSPFVLAELDHLVAKLANIVVIARRHRTREILILDERYLRALNGPGEHPFRILPAKA